MREIKFRVWDKENKTMITHEQNFIPFLKVTNIGVFRLNPNIKEDNWELIIRDEFDIMQFTGLTDKNGKEIYAGDKIETYRLNESHYDAVGAFDVEPQCNWNIHEVYFEKEIATVVFKNGCFFAENKYNSIPLFYLYNRDFESKLRTMEEYGQLDFTFEKWLQECELTLEDIKKYDKYIKVIGNIYENSEITEQQ